jgi:hypothetical protein
VCGGSCLSHTQLRGSPCILAKDFARSTRGPQPDAIYFNRYDRILCIVDLPSAAFSVVYSKFAPHIARAPPPPAPRLSLATASPTTALQRRPTPSLTTSDRNALVRGRHTNNPRPYSASPDRSHHAASRARHVPSPSSVIPSVHRPQAPRRQAHRSDLHWTPCAQARTHRSPSQRSTQ